MLKKWYENFSAQPHQSFFANGIILLVAFSALLLGAYGGFVSLRADVTRYHAYAFIFVLFILFFLGFLFVVFPKFLVQAAVKPEIYIAHCRLYFISSYGLFFSFLFGGDYSALFFASLGLIAQIRSFSLLFSIYKRSVARDKYDSKWILIGLFCGLIFNFLYIAYSVFFSDFAELERLAITGGFFLFLFVVVFAVSQRMIPFFTSVKVQGYVINKSKFLMEKIFVLLALKILAEAFLPSAAFAADAALFAVTAYEIYRWKLPLLGVNSILWILYVSLYWIPIGFLLSFAQGLSEILELNLVFEKAPLHAFALGYFFTILVGFGTRVTLGHSGRAPHADGMATAIFVFTQAVVFSRIFAAFSLNLELDYLFFIELSLILFMCALLVWGCRYLPTLIKGYNPSKPQPSEPKVGFSLKENKPTSSSAWKFKK